MKKISKKRQKSALCRCFAFANLRNDAIFYSIGCGSPVSIAEAAAVKGGDLQKFYGDSVFESAGRTLLCGVTIDTSSTPAGSFFVPDVEVWEKIREKLVDRRLELCKTILRTVPIISDSPG